MTVDQIILFALLVVLFGLLIWGRFRYDLVAFGALVIALVAGVVPREAAFSGFGHPATVIIALVLIVSRGLSASGAVELLTRHLVNAGRALSAHIGIMSGVAAALSAVMNNVAALALLMPVDMQAAARAKRSPALTLMPLSFASILGGMITLIGTPPNIVIASFRQRELGEAYAMFDFAPVGLIVAVTGVLFVAIAGWRLIPGERGRHDTGEELKDFSGYIAEAKVPAASKAVDRIVSDLDDAAEESGVAVLGLVRRGKRLPGFARREQVRKGDTLVVQGGPQAIEQFAGSLGLEYAGDEKRTQGLTSELLTLMEVVVPEGARVAGRSALSLRLLYRHDVTLLGVSRRGQRFRERVRKLEIQPGDLLLLLGAKERLPEVAAWLGCLPLAERGLEVIHRHKASLAIGIFATAIGLASFGVIYLSVALAAAAVLMVLTRIISVHEVYEAVEWPVVVLLGSLIPIGAALEQSGGTDLIAGAIVSWTEGFGPVVVLAVLMIITMTLSDVLNNVATALIAAPIGVDIAHRLGVNPDPFLMGVAVAASCAFLTPIGHKNNTIIMGPGGYQFGDYWRMGLPLEVLVIGVGLPAILWVWPL